MLSDAKQLVAVCVASMALIGVSEAVWAAYLLEIDTDGADDAVLTFNSGFSFGGDTTTASQSVTSTAFGTTGGDSIFGGDGSILPDTYVYEYAPDTQPDNLVIPAGQALGEGNLGTGVVGGGPGTYKVYATWNFTSNVSGGLTSYQVDTAGDSFTASIDQNGPGPGRGNVWVLLGTINYTSGPITVQQTASSNTFVSMRAYGLLFEFASSCLAADGENLSLMDDTVLNSQVFEVCDTIEIGPNYQVSGPNGNLTLKAGNSVIFKDGASVGIDGTLSVEIDPSLQP